MEINIQSSLVEQERWHRCHRAEKGKFWSTFLTSPARFVLQTSFKHYYSNTVLAAIRAYFTDLMIEYCWKIIISWQRPYERNDSTQFWKTTALCSNFKTLRRLWTSKVVLSIEYNFIVLYWISFMVRSLRPFWDSITLSCDPWGAVFSWPQRYIVNCFQSQSWNWSGTYDILKCRYNLHPSQLVNIWATDSHRGLNFN